MVLGKNYKQLAGWSALPSDLLRDVEAAGKNSTKIHELKAEDQREELAVQTQEDNSSKEILSEGNPDIAPLEPNKKPKSWLRKSLSVIGKALRDSNQTQHIHQAQADAKENGGIRIEEDSKEETDVLEKSEDIDCQDDTEKELANSDASEGTPQEDTVEVAEEEGTPLEDTPESAGEEDTPAKTQVTPIILTQEARFLNITPSEKLRQLNETIDTEEEEEEEDLEAKVENLTLFVKDTDEMMDQGDETNTTKANKALQDSTMKDHKVTDAIAAAVIIGAGVLSVLSMSGDVPDSEIIAMA